MEGDVLGLSLRADLNHEENDSLLMRRASAIGIDGRRIAEVIGLSLSGALHGAAWRLGFLGKRFAARFLGARRRGSRRCGRCRLGSRLGKGHLIGWRLLNLLDNRSGFRDGGQRGLDRMLCRREGGLGGGDQLDFCGRGSLLHSEEWRLDEQKSGRQEEGGMQEEGNPPARGTEARAPFPG